MTLSCGDVYRIIPQVLASARATMKRPEGFGQGKPPARRRRRRRRGRQARAEAQGVEGQGAQGAAVRASARIPPGPARRSSQDRARAGRTRASQAPSALRCGASPAERATAGSRCSRWPDSSRCWSASCSSPCTRPSSRCRTVVVEGTSRIPAADVQTAVAGQLGTAAGASSTWTKLHGALNAFAHPELHDRSRSSGHPGHQDRRAPAGRAGRSRLRLRTRRPRPARDHRPGRPNELPATPFIDAKGDLQGTAFRSMAEVLPGPARRALLATVESISGRRPRTT